MFGLPSSHGMTKVGELGLRGVGYGTVRWCHKVAQLKCQLFFVFVFYLDENRFLLP